MGIKISLNNCLSSTQTAALGKTKERKAYGNEVDDNCIIGLYNFNIVKRKQIVLRVT